MCGLSERSVAAAHAIDLANEADPTAVVVRGERVPLAWVHGRLAAEWVHRLYPEAGELVSLAARAHHLRRWELPRSNYPEGKVGYHRWKRDQRARHANDIGELLAAHGYSADDIAAVQGYVRRDDLATNAGSQAVEDAACLVFIETQLADVRLKLDRDHLIDVIRKTARKMSPTAIGAVSTIPLGPDELQLLADALG